MADDKKKGTPQERVTPEQRMKYIGFEVFPGKPKDLFKNDKEKQSFVERVLARRHKGEIIRDDCKLMEERVSMGERLVLAVASLVVIVALFLPWYSVYTETAEELMVATQEQIEPEALPVDSMAGDSVALGQTTATDSLPIALAASEETDPVAGEAAMAGDSVLEQEAAAAVIESEDEIITGHAAKTRYHREYTNLSGVGSLAALGSVGSSIFGSGFLLMLTGFLYLIYTLLCLALPVLTVYVAFGLKGSSDELALKLKKYLQFSWIPVLIFVFTLVISFFGAEYAEGVAGSFTSVGESYGPGVFLTTLSWGVFISMAGFVLIAVKGIEI